MSAKYSLDWEEAAPAQFRIGLVSSQKAFRLAYLINQEMNWSLIRQKKDHFINNQSGQFRFALFKGWDPKIQTPVYLLENRSYSHITDEEKTSLGLFQEQAIEREAQLCQHRRKPDYFVVLEPQEGSNIDINVLTLHLGQIKGVLFAFELKPLRAKDEANFILD